MIKENEESKAYKTMKIFVALLLLFFLLFYLLLLKINNDIINKNYLLIKNNFNSTFINKINKKIKIGICAYGINKFFL